MVEPDRSCSVDADDPVLTGRLRAAAAVRRLGHALVGHDVDARAAEHVASLMDAAAEEIETFARRSRVAELGHHPRFREAVESGQLSSSIEDGETIELFAESFVSGAANPLGTAVTLYRDGDEVVAVGQLGAAFEGAPGRGHGGIVAAIVDETMGGLLPIIGEPAFTARLSLTYRAPAALGEELTFRARLSRRSGRKLTITAEGRCAHRVFVEAEALFISVDPKNFASDADRRLT
ncbi:MAG TPA: PaaI family thioesterase [Acidimicrobiia bacterium]|nr:PaaI family thioesterase [Acidimicrobiia bacterium]